MTMLARFSGMLRLPGEHWNKKEDWSPVILPKDEFGNWTPPPRPPRLKDWYKPEPPPKSLCTLIKERDAALARAEKAEATIAETWAIITATGTCDGTGKLQDEVSRLALEAADLAQQCAGLRTVIQKLRAGIKEVFDGSRP